MNLGTALAGLGALAGGVVKGDMLLKDRARDDENQAFLKEQRARNRIEWADQDKIRLGTDAADKAFADALTVKPQPQMSLAPVNTTSLLQAPPAAPASPDTPEAPTQEAPQMSLRADLKPVAISLQAPGAAKPVDEAKLLSAMEARSMALMNAGLFPQFKEAWGQAADLRSKVRMKAFDKAEAEMRATGDPMAYARHVYPLINDGYDFIDGKLVAGEDGKRVVNITRRNQDSGKEDTVSMPEERYLAQVNFARDPNAVRSMEAAKAKAMFDNLMDIEKEKAKAKVTGDEHRATEGVKHGYAVTLEGIKSANNIKETGVRLAGEGGNAIKLETLKQTAPVSLSEGQTRFVPQRQPNGEIKYVPVATAPKTATTNPLSSRLQKLVNDNFGQINNMNGQRIGNQDVMDIATAAEILVRGGMPELQAVNKAATDFAASKAARKGAK